MTDVKTIQPKKKERQRWPRAAVGLAMFVIAVVLGILVNKESGVASPESVATAWMESWVAHDGDAATALMTPGALYDGRPVNTNHGFFEWDRAVGMEIALPESCQEISSGPGGTLVDCPFLVEDAWTRALGFEASPGGFQFLVDEGLVKNATYHEDDNGVVMIEAWSTFDTWLSENHPDDVTAMYVSGGNPRTDPEAIALFEQYTEEFVASLGG